MDYIRDLIRDVPDFPKKGIVFKDITPVLSDIKALRMSVKEMASPFMNLDIDVVVGGATVRAGLLAVRRC